jgi:hypothetical protein
LLFTEQVAALVVLSTLAICGLLIVVAFSNLETRDAAIQPASIRDASEDMRSNTRGLRREERIAA